MLRILPLTAASLLPAAMLIAGCIYGGMWIVADICDAGAKKFTAI